LNAALLALLPLGLAGAALGLFARGWLEAFAAASPSVAPPWWRALPPLLLACGVGAWWGGRRVSSVYLVRSATWLAVAAAVALLAPRLAAALLPAVPAPSAWGTHAAAWLGALLPAAACGGALVLLMAAREAAADDIDSARVIGVLGIAATVVLGWSAIGLPEQGGLLRADAWPALSAGALVLAALLARLLAAWETPREPPRTLADGHATLDHLSVAACSFAATTLLLVFLQMVRALGGASHSTPGSFLAPLGAVVLLAVVVRRLGAYGSPAAAQVQIATLPSGGLIVLFGALLVQRACAESLPPGRAHTLLMIGMLGGLPLLDSLTLTGQRRPGGAGAGWLALAAGTALAVGWPALEVANVEPTPAGTLFLRGALAAAAASLLGLAGARAGPAPLRVLRLASMAATVLIGALLLLRGAPELPWSHDPPGSRLLAREEGLRGVATLVGLPDGRAEPRRDGRPLVGSESGALQLRRAGRLAAALKPDAQQAALLLRDDGTLLASLAAVTPAHVTCVEPDAALVVLQPDIAYEPGQDARAAAPRLVLDEPRAWLLAHPRSQDLVVQNLFAPDEPGAQDWLTVEHFLALRGALREGGVAAVVLPLQRLPWPAFAATGAAFLQAFPDARLAVASLRSDAPLALLAGGLSHGLPGIEALDGVLAALPSAAGPNGAPDVFDLYVCDGWTLAARWRSEAPATLAAPRAAWLAAGRAADAPLLARLNLRLLADLAVPLETTSLQARPIDEKVARRLGAELTARSAALTGLLAARAAQLAVDQAVPGELSDDQRAALEAELSGALLHAWRSAPGHLDARDALLERAARLTRDERHEAAATLLDQAVQVLPEPRLAGLLGGLLLRLERPDQALALLEPAHQAAPEDRTVSFNLACSLLVVGRDAEAHAILEGASRAAAPQALPPVPAAALGLLRGDVAAVAPAREVLRALPAGDPWASVVARLLGTPPGGGPPPAR